VCVERGTEVLLRQRRIDLESQRERREGRIKMVETESKCAPHSRSI